MGNKLFIVSAPSGSGKTFIFRTILTNEVVSFTTRDMRDGEREGKDYNFITMQDFNEMLERGELAEETNYSGNFYGLTMKELQTKLDKDHAFVVVDFNGMLQLKELYPYCVTIFIESTKEDCMKNMLMRGDSLLSIKKRMRTYDDEIKNQIFYDYKVKNKRGSFYRSVEIVKAIIEQETKLD